MTNPVIQPSKVNRVTVDILRPLLVIAEADSTYSLNDPLARTVPTALVSQKGRFILADYPKRGAVYPQIVLSMINTPGSRIDRRDSFYQSTATIRHQILCKNTTNGHNILNGLIEFYQRDHDDLSEAGLIEPKIAGTSGPTPKDETGTFTFTLTIECLIYSKYIAP